MDSDCLSACAGLNLVHQETIAVTAPKALSAKSTDKKSNKNRQIISYKIWGKMIITVQGSRYLGKTGMKELSRNYVVHPSAQ